MPKIIFCGDIRFPHGSASANYVQCLASAFMELGFEAIVCSNVETNELVNDDNNFFRNIKIVRLNNPGGGFKRLYNLRANFLPAIERYLDGLKLSSEDILVSYAITPEISSFVLKYARRTNMHSLICPVEWFDAAHYSGGILSHHYWVFARNFYCLTPRFEYVFSISERIHQYFKNRNCNSLKIPCMVDTHEYQYEGKQYSDKVKIMFPGVPGEKGIFTILSEALDRLDDTELDQIEIHFTRLKQEQLEGLLSEKLKKRIGSTFVLHGWLSYNDLVELYMKMNYLYLLRESSCATISNFPSKGPESMQYGVVPIVSKLGDFENDYVKAGVNGIVLDKLNADELLHNLRKMISFSPNEYAELSLGARITAKQKFDYRNWTDTINTFINKK